MLLGQEKEDDNLFIAENATMNAYLKNGGDIGYTTGSCVSGFMEFKEGETYYIETKNRWRYTMYKEDKTFLKEVTCDCILQTNLIAPTNAAYIRFCVYNDYIETTIYKKVS